jgi:hypothetical protein
LEETLDGGEDIVRGFDPFVGFRVFFMALDEGPNVGFQLAYRIMDTAPQLLSGKLGEPAFGLINSCSKNAG